MGNRHREIRQNVKRKLGQSGFRENELGELVRKVSKTEARQIVFTRIEHQYALARQLVGALTRQAMEEIYRMEDARIFRDLNLAY